MQIFIVSTTRIRLLYSPIIFRLVYFFESYHFALYIRIYIYIYMPHELKCEQILLYDFFYTKIAGINTSVR